MTLGWGIAGTGRIAASMADVLREHPQMQVVAVGSRDVDRARAAAERMGPARAYGSYESLVRDPQVQAVYVATPHTAHAEVVEAALAAGKAVLCEKPLTADLDETTRLTGLAAEADVFLMEAMWMRFNPLVLRLQELVRSGGLGEVRTLRASFGFAAAYDPAGRLWDPALGGGALLDLGVYCADLARLLLGDPDRVAAVGSLAPTGVDQECALALSWASGARALLDCSLVTDLPGEATVVGSAGWARLSPSFHAPTELVVQTTGEPVRRTIPDRRAGFVGEAEEVARCLRDGLRQSAVMPLADSVGTMRVLHQAHAQLGR